MFTTILVPLDGTRFAEAAIEPAASLARHYESTIVLVHAGAETLFEASSPVDLNASLALQPYLRTIAGQLHVQGIPTEIIEADKPAGRTIVETAMEVGASLVVMATHQRSWLDRLIHPGVAAGVLQGIPMPLLLIRPEVDAEEWVPTVPFADDRAPILVPLDGSPLAETALPLAASLARAYGKPLLLLRVVEILDFNLYPEYHVVSEELMVEGALREARDYLEQQRHALVAQGLAVNAVVRRGSSATVIADTAAEWHADLIVMTAHARNTLARFFLGSVTRGVLHLPGPALLIQPDKQVKAAETLGAARRATH